MHRLLYLPGINRGLPGYRPADSKAYLGAILEEERKYSKAVRKLIYYIVLPIACFFAGLIYLGATGVGYLVDLVKGGRNGK